MKRQRKSKRSGKRDRKPYRGRRKRQMGGFLNRYDLAYASRDTINQAAKVAPGVIKNASNEINNIGKDRINQIITQVRKKWIRFFPKCSEQLLTMSTKMSAKHHLECSEILGNNSKIN